MKEKNVKKIEWRRNTGETIKIFKKNGGGRDIDKENER